MSSEWNELYDTLIIGVGISTTIMDKEMPGAAGVYSAATPPHDTCTRFSANHRKVKSISAMIGEELFYCCFLFLHP